MRSTRFKVMMSIIIILLIIMVLAMAIGFSAPQSSAMGAATTPIQAIGAQISASFNDFFGAFSKVNRLEEENAQLKKELQKRNEELIEFYQFKQQNEQMKDYLGIRDLHPDFTFEPARVISRDPTNRFYAFTIDKGTMAGVSKHDPVRNADGLVGYVIEAAPTYSVVMTVLDGGINIGAMSYRTLGADTGIVSGDITLSKDGLCRLNFLPQDCKIAVGDLIITTGIGGIFPKDMPIGTVKEIKQNQSDISVYAVIQPAADIRELRDVFVITHFDGQGGIDPEEE